MTADFVSLSISLVGTIASFCEPSDLCSLAATCRIIHGKLNLTISKFSFPEWQQVARCTHSAARILRLPFLYHSQPHFVHLSVKVDRLTQCYIVSVPASNDGDPMGQGQRGSVVSRLSLDDPSCTSGHMECLVDPTQAYSLWAEGCGSSGPESEGLVTHFRVHVLKTMVWNSPPNCLSPATTKLEQLQCMIRNPSLTLPVRETLAANYDLWFFFTKLLFLSIETPGFLDIPSNLDGESTGHRISTLDVVRALQIFKILLKVCCQVRGHESDMDCSVQLKPQPTYLGHCQNSSCMELPPICLRRQLRRDTWNQQLDQDDLSNKILTTTQPVSLHALFPIWHATSRFERGLDPSSHFHYVDRKAREFALRYTFHIDRGHRSCVAYLEPIVYGHGFACGCNLEMTLSLEQDRSEVVDCLLPLMQKCHAASCAEDDTLSSVKSVSSLLYLFLGIIGQALIECQAPGYPHLQAFANSTNVYPLHYGVPSLPMLYQFYIDTETASCHVHMQLLARHRLRHCTNDTWDIILCDDGGDVSSMLSSWMKDCLVSFMDNREKSSFISSLSLMLYGFLRTVTQALIACNGPSGRELVNVIDMEFLSSDRPKLTSSGQVDAFEYAECETTKHELFLACFDADCVSSLPLCYVRIKLSNGGFRNFEIFVSTVENGRNVPSLISRLMHDYLDPFKKRERLPGAVFGLLREVAKALMKNEWPQFRALSMFLQENGFSTDTLGLEHMVELVQKVLKGRNGWRSELLTRTKNFVKDVTWVQNDLRKNIGLLTIPCTALTTITGFCLPRDSYSLSCTCRNLYENLTLTRLQPSSFRWSYSLSLDHDIQQLIKLPVACPDRLHYATFTMVMRGADVDRFLPLKFYIVTRPRNNDSTECIQDKLGNVGSILIQTESIESFNAFGFKMTFAFEPHQDYFLWAKGKPSFHFEVHLDMCSIVLCHPTGSCLQQTLTAFESIRAMIVSHSALSNIEKYPEVGAYGGSPLFCLFVKLFAVAVDFFGCSMFQRLCTTILVVPTNQDSSRALTIFLAMCQGSIGLEATSTSVGGDLQGKCIHKKQHLVPLPPIRFARANPGDSYSKSACGWFVPLVPYTKRIRLTGRFNEPCVFRLEIKTQCSIHDRTVLDPIDHFAHWDEDAQAFVCSCEFEINPNVPVRSFRPYPVETCKLLSRYWDVDRIMEDDGSTVTALLLLLMETFLKSFLEFDDSKLSLLVFGLLEAVVQLFISCDGQGENVVEVFLEEQGFSTSFCGLKFLLDSISLTSSVNARYESIPVHEGLRYLRLRYT